MDNIGNIAACGFTICFLIDILVVIVSIYVIPVPPFVTEHNLSKAVVSKYENDLGYPTFDTLIQISEYFNVTTDYILGVNRGASVDVTGLSPSQIELVSRIVEELQTVNNKEKETNGR